MSHYQETLFAVRCESIAHEVGAPTVWTGQGESDHTERTLAYHPDVSRYPGFSSNPRSASNRVDIC